MNTDGRVVIQIDGDDTDYKQKIKSVGTSLNGLKSLIVKLGLGTILAKSVKDAITSTNAFEDSLAKASTLIDTTTTDMKKLGDEVLALSTKTGKASDEIGNALYDALSAGVNVADAMSFLDKTTELAVAGFTEVDQAVQSVAKVWNAYGKDIISVDEISKILIETQNLGITTVDQLSQSLANVTPTASSFGVSFEQVGASLAVMTKAGTDTATATTQLSGMITELGRNNTKVSKILKSETGKSFKELIADGYTLQEVLQIINDNAEANGLSLVDMFSNIRAGKGAIQILSDETQTFNRFLEDMGNDADIVSEAYDKVMGTRSKKWALLKRDLSNIAIEFVQSPESQKLLDTAYEKAETFLTKFQTFMKMLPNMLEDLPTALEVIMSGLADGFAYIFSYDNIKEGFENVCNILTQTLPALFSYIGNLALSELMAVFESWVDSSIIGEVKELVDYLDSDERWWNKVGNNGNTKKYNAKLGTYTTELAPQKLDENYNVIEPVEGDSQYFREKATEAGKKFFELLGQNITDGVEQTSGVVNTIFSNIGETLKSLFLSPAEATGSSENTQGVSGGGGGAGTGDDTQQTISFWDKLKSRIADVSTDLEEFGKTWVDVLTEMANQATEMLDNITGYFTQFYENKASLYEQDLEAQRKNGTLTLEDELKLQDKIDAEKKKAFEAEKKNSIAQALINGAVGVAKAWSDNPWYLALAISAMVTASTAMQVATISSQQYQGFEQGGIVGGSGITGDRHQIWANAGELILTRAQQNSIASQLQGNNHSSNISIEFSGNVFGNEQEISEYVYNGIKKAQYNGDLAQW